MEIGMERQVRKTTNERKARAMFKEIGMMGAKEWWRVQNAVLKVKGQAGAKALQ